MGMVKSMNIMQIVFLLAATLVTGIADANQLAKQFNTKDDFTCLKSGVKLEAYTDKDPHPNDYKPPGFPEEPGLPGLPQWNPKWFKLAERKADIGLFRRNGSYALAISFKDTGDQKNVFPMECDEFVLTNYYKSDGTVYRGGDFANGNVKNAIMKPYAFGSNCKLLKAKDNSIVDTSRSDVTERNMFSATAYSIDYANRNYNSLDDARINAADLNFTVTTQDTKQNRKLRISLNIGVEGLGGLTCKYD
jgi:hypothetical protein